MLQFARNYLRGLFTFVLLVGAAQAQLIYNPGQGGGGGGSGTVTSIGLTQTGTVFTIGGSPVTTNGNINLAFSATGMATFLATPSSANLFVTLTTKTGSGGSVVFATGPTVSGLILSDVATGTQCLHANSSGVVSGTGSDCGAGGGGDTITSPNSTLTVGGTTTNTTLDLNLTNPNSWTGLQTFGAHASIAATAHGVLLSEGASAVVATAVGATNTVFLGNTGADPSFGAVPLTAMATQGANTILGNYTAGTAVPTAGAAPAGGTSGCSGTTDAVIYTASTGWGCHQISGASTALSSVTAAAGANTIANGNNGAQIWNWAQTTAGQVAFTFGETTAATSTGVPYELRATTLAGSTATPLKVDNSLTGSQTLPTLSILPTWNTTGVVDAALLINATNTASGTASLLIDAQIGGTSQFKVDKAGNVTALTSIAVGNPTGGVGSSFFLTQEGTVPSGLSAAGQDNCYADSTQHGILCNYNAGTTLPLIQGPASNSANIILKFSGTNGGKAVASTLIDNATTVSTTEPFVSSTFNTCPDTSASGSVQVCNTTPTFTPVAGSCVTYTTTTANTGTGLTLNVNSLGAKSVAKWQGATTLAANDVLANKDVLACYDGTNWELATIGNAPSGGGVSSVNTLTGAVVIENATAGQMAVSGGGSAALTGASDMTYTTHTFATITTGIFDWSAATGASSFKLPAVIGGTILAGTSTANLSAPIVIQNTNSSNSNTSITMGITAPGTSTAQTVLNVNGAATGADLQDWGTGGTWASGVLSGQTVVAAMKISGALALGTATCTTFGTAGGICPAEGTAPTNVSGAAPLYPDSTAHEYMAKTNGSASPGMMNRTQPGAIRSTGLVASVGTATLCAASAGACNTAGTYRVHVALYQSGVACTTNTTGGVSVQLTWTDGNATAHTAITMPLITNSSLVALTGTMLFNQTAAGIGTVYGSGDLTIDTNGSIIQYATTYGNCSVTGTATYAISAAVIRLQ